MNEGWLCDSILKTTHKPSPMSTAPAFSPGPCTTRGPVVGSFFKWARELLYEQCSDHMTENMPSSVRFGSRHKISRIFLYSSSVKLCCVRSSLRSAVFVFIALYTSQQQRFLLKIWTCARFVATKIRWTALPRAKRLGNGL